MTQPYEIIIDTDTEETPKPALPAVIVSPQPAKTKMGGWERTGAIAGAVVGLGIGVFLNFKEVAANVTGSGLFQNADIRTAYAMLCAVGAVIGLASKIVDNQIDRDQGSGARTAMLSGMIVQILAGEPEPMSAGVFSAAGLTLFCAGAGATAGRKLDNMLRGNKPVYQHTL